MTATITINGKDHLQTDAVSIACPTLRIISSPFVVLSLRKERIPMIPVVTISGGLLPTNCYLFVDERTGSLLC